MSTLLRSTLATGLLLTLATSAAVAANCSREDIDHYLDRGFTPDQVIDLCGQLAPSAADTPVAAPEATPAPDVVAPVAPVATPAVPVAAPAAPASRADNGLDDESFFTIKHALDADEVQVTDAELIYTRDRCHRFGEEDAIGQRPIACVVTRTTISRAGFEILKAVKGILLIQDRQFLVSADRIQREVLTPEKITNARERKLFLEEFSTNPKQLDIPLRRGYEPPELAPLFQKLAR